MVDWYQLSREQEITYSWTYNSVRSTLFFFNGVVGEMFNFEVIYTICLFFLFQINVQKSYYRIYLRLIDLHFIKQNHKQYAFKSSISENSQFTAKLPDRFFHSLSNLGQSLVHYLC